MNSYFLQNTLYEVGIVRLWESWQSEKHRFDDISYWWDVGKARLRDLSRRFGRDLSASRTLVRREHQRAIVESVNVRWTVVVCPLSIHWPNIVVPCPISTDTNWKGSVSVPVCHGRSRARRRLSCLPTSRDSEHTMVTSIGFVTSLVHHTVVLKTFSTWGVLLQRSLLAF